MSKKIWDNIKQVFNKKSDKEPNKLTEEKGTNVEIEKYKELIGADFTKEAVCLSYPDIQIELIHKIILSVYEDPKNIKAAYTFDEKKDMVANYIARGYEHLLRHVNFVFVLRNITAEEVSIITNTGFCNSKVYEIAKNPDTNETVMSLYISGSLLEFKNIFRNIPAEYIRANVVTEFKNIFYLVTYAAFFVSPVDMEFWDINKFVLKGPMKDTVLSIDDEDPEGFDGVYEEETREHKIITKDIIDDKTKAQILYFEDYRYVDDGIYRDIPKKIKITRRFLERYMITIKFELSMMAFFDILKYGGRIEYDGNLRFHEKNNYINPQKFQVEYYQDKKNYYLQVINNFVNMTMDNVLGLSPSIHSQLLAKKVKEKDADYALTLATKKTFVITYTYRELIIFLKDVIDCKYNVSAELKANAVAIYKLLVANDILYDNFLDSYDLYTKPIYQIVNVDYLQETFSELISEEITDIDGGATK